MNNIFDNLWKAVPHDESVIVLLMVTMMIYHPTLLLIAGFYWLMVFLTNIIINGLTK